MKKTLIVLAAIFIAASSFAQGVVVFNNRVTGLIDAPVMRGPANPGGAGEGVTAQLMLVGAGGALTPLIPTTTFRTTSVAATPYVNGVDVTVPGVEPGNAATLRMVAYQTAAGSFEAARNSTSFAFGQSNDITVTLGGGTLPPANLVGLQGFSMFVVPEPSTIALGILGAAALLFRRRK